MMLMAFSLLDTKTGHFSPPFFMGGRGQAIRAVMELGADMSTTVGRHPGDFSLVQLGQFDDQTGVLTPCHPDVLGVVSSFLPAAAAGPLFNFRPEEATGAISNGVIG